MVQSPSTYLALTASLICFGGSLVILGSTAPTQPPPTSSKAAHPERSTGRCRSKATGRATILFFLFQLLGLSSAETLAHPELAPSPSSVSVWAVLLIIGLLLFGEACCPYDFTLTLLHLPPLPLCISIPFITACIPHFFSPQQHICCAGVAPWVVPLWNPLARGVQDSETAQVSTYRFIDILSHWFLSQ